jgi:hypothetical protein
MQRQNLADLSKLHIDAANRALRSALFGRIAHAASLSAFAAPVLG